MRFRVALRETLWILLTEKRSSAARLKQELSLSDEAFNALVHELTHVKKWAKLDLNDDLVCLLAGLNVDSSAPTAEMLAARLPDQKKDSTSTPSTGAERRQLTVMFCDLAGSTALSNELDPEDMNDLVVAYQNTVAPILKQYNGFLAKYMGDGILAYFGYPKAQEKDAERAIYAALAITEAIRELAGARDPRLAVRIGIATGTVIVGELIGEGEAQERSVVGDAPNLAARLQDAAPPNGVLISEVTRDLAGDAFEIASLGTKQLKGIDEPVEVWQVLREQDEEFSVEADVTGERPSLVGRQEELGLLTRAWQQARQGAGQVVSISGEAGIGKSRLVEAILAEAAADGATRITLRCSPHHSNSALFPAISQVRRAMGWTPEDQDEQRCKKLEETLASYKFSTADTLPLFAALLSLQVDPHKYPPLELPPQQLRLNTLDALLSWLFEEAERRPTIVIWEDIHWADPSTLELLEMMIEQCPTVPILNVLTFRPDFIPGWAPRTHVLPITLSRLERPEVESLIMQACKGKRLPPEVVNHIVERGDGVPLYVGELTSAILASDALRETPDSYELAGPLENLSIPATLQDSLLARLDKAPNVREVAQLGAVFGREFAYELVQALGAFDDNALKEGLERLVKEELLYRRGRLPRAKFMFKHALIQDAAYQSLLKRTRQRYHAAVANLLLDRFGETAETQPEIVAHHFTEAGDVERAIQYWLQAGQDALRRSENHEAIGHLKKGLTLLPAGGKLADKELAMLRPLATAYMAAKGYAAPETVETFERARKLCSVVEDDSIHPVMFGVWLATLFRGNYAQAHEMTVEMIRLAENATVPYASVAAQAASGFTYLHMGDQPNAIQDMDVAIKLGENFDLDEVKAQAFLYGLDIRVATLAYSAWSQWLLGYPDAAAERQKQALNAQETSGHHYSKARALYWCGVVSEFLGDWRTAAELADRANELGRRQGLNMVETASRVLSIATHAELGESGSADALAAALHDYTGTGALFQNSYHRTLHAKVLASEGRIDEGLDVLDKDREMIRQSGEAFYLPEVLRLKGVLLMTQDDTSEEARSLFREAIDCAAAGNSRSLELRAAISLANWTARNSKAAEAKSILLPRLSWFTQGFETKDLRDARALLDRL